MSSLQAIKDYYEGPVEAIYRAINGEILHLAMFRGDESRQEATQRTKEFLASRLEIGEGSRVVDLGSGYGDAARYLVKRFDCQVIGVNITHSQNVQAKDRNKNEGLIGKTFVVGGDFAFVPLNNGCARVVWSQEAFLHGLERGSVIREAYRLLVQGGDFIFTDILRLRPLKEKEAAKIFRRVKIESMETFSSYRTYLQDAGFRTLEIADLSKYMAASYKNHVDMMVASRDKLAKDVDDAYIERTIQSMERWVKAAEDGKIGWGMFHARKS